MTALSLALMLVQTPNGVAYGTSSITYPDEKIPSVRIQWNTDPADPSFKSPKTFGPEKIHWEFPWITLAYGADRADKNDLGLKFRVFSQDRKSKDDPAYRASQMLIGLWSETRKRLNVDHAELYNGGIVDVYLCWGGKPGGEQRFDVGFEGNREKKLNTIYFYDLPSFTDPVEMAREVAHEYGHAVLPAVGGYSAPEYWANGYLGEKLFLRWMSEEIDAGHFGASDVMGAETDGIRKWVETNVNPLVLAAAKGIPNRANLAGSSSTAMNRYLGLALLMDSVMPESMFHRSMLLAGSTKAADYIDGLTLAAEEPDSYDVRIPKFLSKIPFWFPVGRGKISGAKILSFRGKWAQVSASAGTIHVTNRTQ
jgi:hypothetical protein